MHLIIYGIISVLIVILDFVTKRIVTSNMEIQDTIPLIEGVFNITYIENKGASFGMLQGARWFFITITVIFITALIIFIIKSKEKNKMFLISASFIVGGGIGNFIDRVVKGAVVDFFDFELINFPVFNVADCFVVIGITLMCLSLLIIEIRERKLKKSGDTDGNI